MKQIINTFILLCFVWHANAQLWETQIDPLPMPPQPTETTITGYDVQETMDGNYVFAANYKSGVSPNYVYGQMLVKLNASTGTMMWTKHYDLFNGGYMQEVSLVEKANGNLLLAGLENNGIFLIETNANGDTLSTQRIMSSCEQTTGAGCTLQSIRLRSTLDGNYIIGVGSYGGMIGLPQPINQLIKISPTNTILWSKDYYSRFILDVQPTRDGGYVMSGATSVSASMIFKVDMNGDSLWQQEYSGQAVQDLNSIKETPDSGFVVACTVSGIVGYSPFLMKVDSNGANILWMSPAGMQLGQSRHVIVDHNDNYVVTGYRNVPHGGALSVQVDVAFLAKFNPAGNILQNQVFDDLMDNSGYAVRQASDGNFVVAGSYGSSLGNQDRGYVVKTGYFLNTVNVVPTNIEVRLAPNPMEDQTTMKIQGANYQELDLQLYDALGRQVLTVQGAGAELILRKGALQAGVYFYQLRGDGQAIASGKLTVR